MSFEEEAVSPGERFGGQMQAKAWRMSWKKLPGGCATL